MDETRCPTRAALLHALALGRRVWTPAAATADETKPSAFRGEGCTIPHWSAEAARALLRRFELFAVVGDSLSRHMTQGLMMLLSGDYEVGGIVPDKAGTYKDCVCDGQFSESLPCRMLSPQQTSNPTDVASFYMDRTHNGKMTDFAIPCESKLIEQGDGAAAGGGRMVFWLQGGAQLGPFTA